MSRSRGSRKLRIIDRGIGVPMLFVLGAFRRRRDIPSGIARIGVLKLAAIGDTVLLTGVLSDLRQQMPDAELFLFVGEQNASAGNLFSDLGQVVVIPTTDPLEAVRTLRSHKLDVLLDFGSWSRIEAAYAALSGARWTAGFKTKGQSRHWCQDLPVAHSGSIHEVENYRNLVSVVGVHSTSTPRLTPGNVTSSDRLPQKPYVVLHPWPSGFRSSLKEWPGERWVELAHQFDTLGIRPVISGGPDDVVRSTELVRACGPSVINASGHYNLLELLDLLAASECVVSVNTGVVHLAAAIAVPTVCLNGPSSGTRWGPLGRLSVSVDSSLPGCGYLNLGAEYRGQREDCMCGIAVPDVLAAALEIMATARSET